MNERTAAPGIQRASIDDWPEAQRVQLDWKAYFEAFSSLHGGYPVNYKGVLLFQDGWTYSAFHYEGPETAPPTNPRELNTLLRAYWRTRKSIAIRERKELSRLLESLKDIQRQHSAPLQTVVRYLDTQTKSIQSKSEPVDIRLLEMELEQVVREVEHCDETLVSIEEKLSGNTQRISERA